MRRAAEVRLSRLGSAAWRPRWEATRPERAISQQEAPGSRPSRVSLPVCLAAYLLGRARLQWRSSSAATAAEYVRMQAKRAVQLYFDLTSHHRHGYWRRSDQLVAVCVQRRGTRIMVKLN